MNALITLAAALVAGRAHEVRTAWRSRGGEGGASTLEMVILILGLITVATLLVATLTAAVRSRTDQIS